MRVKNEVIFQFNVKEYFYFDNALCVTKQLVREPKVICRKTVFISFIG